LNAPCTTAPTPRKIKYFNTNHLNSQKIKLSPEWLNEEEGLTATLEFYTLWIMFSYKLTQQSAFRIGQNKQQT